MRNPKINQSLWRLQGLAVFVCVLLLILATGTAEARYRAEQDASAEFQVAEPAQIYLGTLSQQSSESDGETVQAPEPLCVFDVDGKLVWTEKEGIWSLDLAVANGPTEESFYAKDQQFRLQIIGTLGLGTETGFPQIELKVPSEEDPEIVEVFQGTASRIIQGSTLYHSFGSGWIIRFRDAEGQEPYWILKGDAQSYRCFTIVLENVPTDSEILLHPQVEASVIQN